MNVMWSKKLLLKLADKGYRAAYVAEQACTGVAYQIRAMREQRRMSQGDLGRTLNKPQSVVSRLEDPDYGKMTVKTLLDIAAAFDVALLIQFVSFPDFIRRTRDVSQDALRVESYRTSQFEHSKIIGRNVMVTVGEPGPLWEEKDFEPPLRGKLVADTRSSGLKPPAMEPAPLGDNKPVGPQR